MADEFDWIPDLSEPIAREIRRKPVVIEKTAKKWKAYQLAGGIMIALFFWFALVAGIIGTLSVFSAISILGLLTGVFLYAYGRIAAWWFHG